MPFVDHLDEMAGAGRAHGDSLPRGTGNFAAARVRSTCRGRGKRLEIGSSASRLQFRRRRRRLQHSSSSQPGKSHREADAETTRSESDTISTISIADVTEVWRRGSVVASWLLDLTPFPSSITQPRALLRRVSPIPAKAAGHPRPPSNPRPRTRSDRLSFSAVHLRGEDDFAAKSFIGDALQFAGTSKRSPGTRASRTMTHEDRKPSHEPDHLEVTPPRALRDGYFWRTGDLTKRSSSPPSAISLRTGFLPDSSPSSARHK